jgi:hypothetical protein
MRFPMPFNFDNPMLNKFFLLTRALGLLMWAARLLPAQPADIKPEYALHKAAADRHVPSSHSIPSNPQGTLRHGALAPRYVWLGNVRELANVIEGDQGLRGAHPHLWTICQRSGDDGHPDRTTASPGPKRGPRNCITNLPRIAGLADPLPCWSLSPKLKAPLVLTLG